ncbi:phosphotransferase enzyme family protein [Streptosporangium amethystogenes]|uniref:phosphotransferase enzyme family protein n=1 Tax=Streptosporangium amethystogenes TaxID=2002 RepID=UPI0004C66546|nr:aminoglycoside phosphotransferase family protein [Streptosporangium amethystogenes]
MSERSHASPFTAESTQATLLRACTRVGLDPSNARLVRLGENAVYRLASPVIARIGRTTAYADDARKEVAVAGWLATEGFPSVRTLSLDQPLIVDGRVATFWESISEEENYASPAELGTLLATLHTMEAPAGLRLPPLEPFARAEHRIAGNDWFSPEDASFLHERLAELREGYAALSFGLPQGVIHGDASVGNVIRDRTGRPTLLDLDGFALGPREWDLVLTAIYYERFGWHTAGEYDAFTQAYGFDVMRWPGYRVLGDVREFLMVTWLSQQAGQDERAAAEVRKRIRALRTNADRGDWEPY